MMDFDPPRNEEFERSLLGAVVVSPEALAAAADVITPGDFYRQAHQRIWEALLRLDVDEAPIDLVSLRSELLQMGALEACGGPAYLGGLVDGMPRVTDRSVTHWAQGVREKARLRALMGGLQAVLCQAAAGEATSAELEAAVERLVSDATPAAGSVLERETVARDTWALLESEVKGQTQGIGTGLPDLDARLRFGGWRPGQLVFVGARTSRGKSALLLGFAEAAAARGKRVLLFPLEMTAQQLGVRRLVAHTGANLAHLQSWRAEQRTYVLSQLERGREILSRPLDFASSAVRTLGQIRAACRRWRQRPGLDLVVVDYLGLVGYDRPGKLSLYERTTLVSQGLKTLAMDLGVPVLCAVQLNREPAGQNGRPIKPSLAHFRDSGAVEQDCDIALLIHQDSTRDAIEDGPCEVFVAKQRDGWTGSVPMRWRAACARFENPASDGDAA